MTWSKMRLIKLLLLRFISQNLMDVKETQSEASVWPVGDRNNGRCFYTVMKSDIFERTTQHVCCNHNTESVSGSIFLWRYLCAKCLRGPENVQTKIRAEKQKSRKTLEEKTASVCKRTATWETTYLSVGQ